MSRDEIAAAALGSKRRSKGSGSSSRRRRTRASESDAEPTMQSLRGVSWIEACRDPESSSR